MRRHVLSNLDDLDPDAHALAKAAARRAGLSLEEWTAEVLAGRSERREPASAGRLRAAGDDLDSIIARFSKPKPAPVNRDYETLMEAVAAESERQAKEQASRTAIALESMAAWMEQAEERLSETARASAHHQDRMASVLSQALSALRDRLDDVERRVVSERAAPARVEFPIQDALKALAPLSDTLTGLRTDMSRLSDRLEQPNPAWAPDMEGIRAEIERLQARMTSLATREEIAGLDRAIREAAADLNQGHSSKDLLALASSIAALYRQVQTLSEDVTEGMHRRIGTEIDLIKSKIDKAAEAGIDRSVIEFLSSQIVDLRQDLAHRADPAQIERLSDDVAMLNRQIADLRANQVGRSDFSALKASLETVCSALSRTVAAQEASDVPGQLQHMNERLDILVNRPDPAPANLDPITEQLAQLTDRMANLSAGRLDQGDALAEMIDRLSVQVQAVADKEPPSQEPLLRRFDRIEEELHQVGRKADTSGVALMLRSIDEKLESSSAQAPSFAALERQIADLAERFSQTSAEPLQKILSAAAGQFKDLQSEAEGIAVRAAQAALKDVQSSPPGAGDVDALKQGLVELKALQTRADRKTQETLRAVHNALETLISRFPAQGRATLPPGTPPDRMPPADRLEAAVRRLHAATLSQIEQASTASPGAASVEAAKEPESEKPMTGQEPPTGAPPALQEADLGNVRAGFIAAARRAAQSVTREPAAPEAPSALFVLEPSVAATEDEAAWDVPPSTPLSSLIERIRQSFERHRRPLLLGLALLILSAGTAQVLLDREASSSVASLDRAEETARPQRSTFALADHPAKGPSPQGSISVFQTASLADVAPPSFPNLAVKYLVDPATVGDIPAQVPPALRQAALTGDATALYEIAVRAAEGSGLDQDAALAIRLFERAAQAGLPPAQERLAMLHEKGIGTARDAKLAATWYERAATGGNIRAMHNLATLLASGVNGKPDYAAALRWYGEAAEAGLRDSQFNMGILFARGIGTKQDFPGAFKWFALAAKRGDADAARKRDEIASRLGSAELAAARASVEQWRQRAIDPIANEISLPSERQTAILAHTPGERS